MNTHNPDNADLTAYALGELPPGQEREMREWIAANPDAQAGLARIEQVAEALHHGAQFPTAKLTLQQRQNVLTPPKSPRILTPMPPRQPVAARRQSRVMPFLAGITKMAAVLAVTAGAFLMGRHAGVPVSSNLAKAETSGTKEQPAPVAQVVPLQSTPVKKEIPSPIVPAPKPAADLAVTPPPALAPEKKTAQPEPGAAAKIEIVTKPSNPAPAQVTSDAKGYASVSRDPVARMTLRPFETRPVPVKMKGTVLASPAAAAPQPANDKGRAPDLYVQSWKAEVASCPWNAGHKLLRVLVQLPADQPASASPANTYPVQVSFDKLTVRSYRLLSETHIPPHPGTNAAAHVVWYEVIPNGTFTDANRETGRLVATIKVPNAHFNSQTVGPFDSSNLLALDRDVKWENAREDFLFETSIVGFGLLLRGEDNLGTLNHELVLKIAEKAAGDKALDGERAKFIKLVQEAKRVTGI